MPPPQDGTGRPFARRPLRPGAGTPYGQGTPYGRGDMRSRPPPPSLPRRDVPAVSPAGRTCGKIPRVVPRVDGYAFVAAPASSPDGESVANGRPDTHTDTAGERNLGPLWDKCETRTKRIPIENGKAVFNDVTFPINPMIGVIGVAPEKGKSVPCGYPGSHGGNLDCKLMVKGNTAYFPVRVEGGLVQMGDMHAVMGDSELCGTGLEINGTVIARVSVIKNCPLEWPVLETADTWYTMASAAGYEEALRHASVQMQSLVAAATGWDATDAYLYMSLRGDLEVCQACKPCEVDLIVRLGVPKADMKRPLVG